MTTNDNSIIISAGKRIYTLDMNTYQATLLATSPYVNEINSIASDATTGWIFYVSNHISSYNWTIYGYNVYTNTHKNFGSVRHFFTSTGHAYSSRGLASGGATFYNGKLYFAMEYPSYCYYGRGESSGNTNPKDELSNNVRATGTVSNSLFTNGPVTRNSSAEADETDNGGRTGTGETPSDFQIIEAAEANELNDLVSDYIPEEDLPADTAADDNLEQRGTSSSAESYGYSYHSSTYNNYMYLLEISFSGLSDASGQTTSVSNGTPVYDNWWYSSFLYRGELGDIVVDDNGQLYAATSYQVQAYNFNSNRYDWANNEDVYAQMAKDKNSALQLLKNKRQCSTYYYYGCPHTTCTTKSFVQSYTAPSSLRTYNNLQIGSLNEISGLNSSDVGRITDASDYIRLTPPVSYKIEGFVFDDNNENGNFNGGQGETKTPGTTVTLYADTNNDGVLDSGDTVIETKVTDSNGSYTFNDVQVSNTLVEVTVTSNTNTTTYTSTTPEVVAVSETTNDVTVNFGINEAQIPVNYDIFGTVYDDNDENAILDNGEAGLDNVTLTLYADNNADGVLDAGDTVITTTTSGTDGSYSFIHVCIQNTIVAVTVPTNTGSFTYTLTTSATQAIDSINTNVTGLDFGINEVQVVNFNISGTVYDDDNANQVLETTEGRLDNVTMMLYADNNTDGAFDTGDTMIASTTTAVDGTYAFSSVTTENTLVMVEVPTNTPNFTYSSTTPELLTATSTTADVTGLNFGVNKVQIIDYSISGNVYDDNDESGAQDAGEDNLESVTVTLYNDANANGVVDAGDTVISSAISAVDGTYSFANVTAPNTVVAVTVPTNTGDFTYLLTTAGEQNTSSLITDVTGVNFGINEVQIINFNVSGTVFDDNNENGSNDAGDGVLDGINVTLYADNNADGNLDVADTTLTSTTTAVDGTYSFTNITTPNVLVVVTTPGNTATFTYVLTTSNTQATSSTTVDVTGLDFGINEVKVINYDISGNVYDDNNGDGVKDAGEGSIGAVTLTLYSDNNNDGVIDAGDTVIGTTTTNSMSGNYNFINVTVENTIVSVTVPTNTAAFTYVLTTSGSQDTTSVLTDLTGVNFGIDRVQVINYNIAGTVFDDDNANGTIDTGENFLRSVTLTLYADVDNNGRVGAADTVIATTTSASDGTYSFSAVTERNTLVAVTVPTNDASFTYVLTTADAIVTDSTITDINGVDFGINREVAINYNIDGFVWDDDNEDGTPDTAREAFLESVTLTLYADNDGNGRVGAGDTVIASTTSAADGTYSFANVTTASTLVEVTVPTNTSTSVYRLTTGGQFVTSSVNTDVTGANFGINEQAATYSISGNVFDDDNENGIIDSEGGISNITIRLYDDLDQNGRVDRGEPLLFETLSDRNGNYEFLGLTNVFVVIQAAVPPRTTTFQYTPTTAISVGLSSGIPTVVNFGINRELVILYNISGLLWDDDNADQVKDPAELVLENINVTLYNDINADGVIDSTDPAIVTVPTSSAGTYTFTGVTAQNVIVQPALPSNGTFTTPGLLALTSVNNNITNANFGIDVVSNTFQVTGVVFDDDNRNGIADPGEGSVNGLAVEIYVDTDGSGTFDSNLDALVAFTQTSNGSFNFTNPNYVVNNVPTGQVFIRVVIPAGNPPLLTYTATYDPDTGTANPDGIFPTIMTGNIAGVNFGIDVIDFIGTPRDNATDDVLITNGANIQAAAVDVSSRLRLYPNPTVREIAINSEEFSGDVTVEIYNDRGYKMMTTTATPFGGELKVDVQRLRPGMYYVKFGSRNKVASKKFVKR